ncbi:MAG: hypothetical protein WAQ57_03425 [Candidatus Saccharimonadales bacterium]
MLRLLARTSLSLLANAAGLLAAAVILNDFSIDGAAFVIAVVIFTAATTILGPFILSVALRSASYLVGGIALVTTLVGLILTSLISDGINISGLSTWILATLIIWIFAVIANVVLPLFMFKQVLQKRRED